MKINSMNNNLASDFQALDALKSKAKTDAKAALPEATNQFEALFVQSMLKSMRLGQSFLDDNSPFKSKNESTFQDMLDSQYALQISAGKGIGLGEMLAKQLKEPETVTEVNTNIQIPQIPTSKIESIAKPSESKAASYIPALVEPKVEKVATTTDEFIKSIWPYAKDAAQALGLDPKILMAQAVLETGWGQFVAKDADGSSSNNVFNIKSSKHNAEPSVNIKTTEYIANTPIKMNANFKKYPSVEQSFHDYVSLLKGSDRYQEALERKDNPEGFMQALHKAGYATDPKYSSKILSIYHSAELKQALMQCD